MARGQRGGRRQQPVKGFRPGKEPPQLRKRRAKEQLGDTSWAQKKLVDVLAERSPEEARRMMRRWRLGALALAVAFTVVAALLYRLSVVAGIGVSLVAVALFVVWLRLHRQRAGFDTLVDVVSGRRRR